MNKGRNIAIFLLCLCCVSLLTFLTTLNRENRSGVVDDVRYYLTDTQEDVKSYDFYFVEGDKMSGTLYTDPDQPEYTITVTDYPFSYTVSGTDKKNAVISYTVVDQEGAADIAPYSLFTEEFLKAMVYGAAPVLSATEAILVALIAAAGGLILGKAEELWSFFHKTPDKEYPEWEDLSKYRWLGGGVIICAVLFLIGCILF